MFISRVMALRKCLNYLPYPRYLKSPLENKILSPVENYSVPGGMVHTFSPSPQETEAGGISKFKASLVNMSSKTARTV